MPKPNNVKVTGSCQIGLETHCRKVKVLSPHYNIGRFVHEQLAALGRRSTALLILFTFVEYFMETMTRATRLEDELLLVAKPAVTVLPLGQALLVLV